MKRVFATAREPFLGIGKPEPLKHAPAGYWSRRITDEHRMVYKPERDALLIAQLRYHDQRINPPGRPARRGTR